MEKDNPSSLAQFVSNLYENSEYIFSVSDALNTLKISKPSLKVALNRLIQKRQIAKLSAGYYVITPVEYKSRGAPPPTWYIDKLMTRLGLDYYVGVLSAAAIHGAAHQQPQEFQIITTKERRIMYVSKARTRFLRKKTINPLMHTTINTPTGKINISTPEMTAFDLITYYYAAGYMSNIATVISELVEKIDPIKLVEIADSGIKLPIVQRLGYLIDEYGDPTLTEPLHQWLKQHKVNPIPLQVGKPITGAIKNTRWRLWINEIVEPDL